MYRHNRRPPSLGLILLLAQLYQSASDHGLPPPTTLSFIVFQILVYLRLLPPNYWPRSPTQACLSSTKLRPLGSSSPWTLLFYSQLEHGDDWHLYYNMASFLIKGRSLEGRLGTPKFTLLLLLFIPAVGMTYVALQHALSFALEEPSFLHTCAVGFSGVIFALKVLTTQDGGGGQILGIPVPSKYAVWLELVLISVITPNASFLGHLAGILVGFAYLYGPLGPFVNFISGVLFNGGRNSGGGGGGRFASVSQPTGYRGQPSQRFGGGTEPRGARNAEEEEEELRRAMEESRRLYQNQQDVSRGSASINTGGQSRADLPPPQAGWVIGAGASVNQDEMRAARLRRFQ